MRKKDTHQQLWCPEVHALMKIQHQQQGNSHANDQEPNQIITNQINTPRFLPNTLMPSCKCTSQSDLLCYCIVVLHLHICGKKDNKPDGRNLHFHIGLMRLKSDVLTKTGATCHDYHLSELHVKTSNHIITIIVIIIIVFNLSPLC